MSLVVVHLRWDDVSLDQYERLCRMLPSGEGLPDDCFSRTLRHQGRVLHGTEVWAGEEAAGRSLAGLPETSASFGLGAPMTVVFSLPDLYAGPYRRAMARRALLQGADPTVGRPATVPGPRTAPDDEDPVAARRQPLARR